jgi:hypothetical protein
MGGTGLEPVTPSLSIAFCRGFALLAVRLFTLVCTLSRGLVVARGSTVTAG